MSYKEGKEAARLKAIETQRELSDSAISYGELSEIQTDLEKLARRYGLIREFKENGLI